MSKLTVLPDLSTGHADYPAVDVASIHHIAIFPPVGITRVGDSDECFLAPEIPGQTSPPQALLKGTEYMFRDAHQGLRRQAARFRVYAYDANNTVLGELNTKNGYNLTWTVDVANKKAAGYIFQSRFPPHNLILRNKAVHPGETDPEKRFKLIVKAEGEISANTPAGFVPLQGKFHGSKDTPVDVDLAQLQLDEVNRLIFVPGKGNSRSVADPNNPQPPVTEVFNNIDWIDEICDGTVTVKVTGNNIPADVPVLGARVTSAPPNFAWGINMPTNLYDVMEDVYHQAAKPRPRVEVDFWKHIWPVLNTATSLSWTNKFALKGHGESGKEYFDKNELFELFKGPGKNLQKRKDFKNHVLEYLRRRLDNDDPDPKHATTRFMPQLSGDDGFKPENGSGDPRNFAALTRLQYERFEKWKNDDNFHLTGDAPPVPQPKLEDLPVAEQPDQLTRAALESTVGDALYPGIEMYWVAKLETAYNITETRINPPFRFNDTVLPGHLGRGLALPWQTDFDACNTNWWPAIRPDNVVVKVKVGIQGYERTNWKRGVPLRSEGPAAQGSGDSMVRHWMQFGIVREVKSASNKGSDFLEEENVVPR